jgi:hypothetical protein
MMSFYLDVPSLICKNCTNDIEYAYRLRQRLQDADEYYSMMTSESEYNFLTSDMKDLIDSQVQSTKAPKTTTTTTIQPKTLKSKKKSDAQENKDQIDLMENDDTLCTSQLNPPKKKSKQDGESLLINLKKPVPSKKSNSKVRKSAEKKVTKPIFECDACKSTFCSITELNQHLETHTEGEESSDLYHCFYCDESFPNGDYRRVHMKARHWKEVENDKIEVFN